MMKRFLILSGFLASAAFLAPVATADDHHDKNEKRYYHKDGHDYHVYNNQEDRAYRAYLQENHRDYREFRKVNRNDQDHYFKWRHDHPDSVLFKLEVR